MKSNVMAGFLILSETVAGLQLICVKAPPPQKAHKTS